MIDIYVCTYMWWLDRKLWEKFLNNELLIKALTDLRKEIRWSPRNLPQHEITTIPRKNETGGKNIRVWHVLTIEGRPWLPSESTTPDEMQQLLQTQH